MLSKDKEKSSRRSVSEDINRPSVRENIIMEVAQKKETPPIMVSSDVTENIFSMTLRE